MTNKLQIVGGGRMGGALAGGLVNAGWATAGNLVVVEPDADRRRALEHDIAGIATAPTPVADVADAVIAVKPPKVAEVAAHLSAVGTRRVLSIAAGITTATIEGAFGAGVVVRAMPNTPALVGAGAAAIAAGARAGDDDLDWAAEVLSAVGVVVRVDESLLDAVTGLSGSGPAYVFLLAEALIDAGVANGLDRQTATTLTVQTLVGAGRLLEGRPHDAHGLRAEVTSPGGTTAAGIGALEDAGFRAALTAAVTAATERSRALSGG